MPELNSYTPDPRWFHRQSSIHGAGHTLRVVILCNLLAGRVDQDVRRAELLTAAMLHDTQRHDDGLDLHHGARAASWVALQFPLLCPETAATLDLEFVAALCRDHNQPTRNLPHPSIELMALKDADALDRMRPYVPPLDPRRLRLPASHELIAVARELERRSRVPGDPAAAVQSAAVDMGVWE